MKYLLLFIILSTSIYPAQKLVNIDTLQTKQIDDFLVDDYGKIYLYQKQNFTLIKLDTLGKVEGKIQLTQPFKIQEIQNPLNIVMFSENVQQVKLVDQNLNEIQSIGLTQFGFIKMAYVEDQQQMWLLDESMKRLLQFNYRQNQLINVYPLFLDMENMIDMLVYKNKIYSLFPDKLKISNLNGEQIEELSLQNAKRLRRENDEILVITDKSVIKVLPNVGSVFIFQNKDAKIVDKNSLYFYALTQDKIYLYPP